MKEEKWTLWISLFICCLGLSVLIRYLPLGNLPLLRKAQVNSDEINDRKVLIAMILTVMIFSILILCRVSLQPLAPIVTPITFTALGLLFGATAAQNYFENYKGQLWFGFGAKVALIAILFVGILYTISNNRKSGISFQIPKRTTLLIWLILALFYLPSVLQFHHGIIDLRHSLYVFNELAGPAAGKYPLGNFTSQYSNLLGYPIILISIFSKGAAITIMSYWTSLLTIIEFLVIGLILRRINRKLPLALLIAFPVFLILVKQNESETVLGSLATLISAIPVRTLMPLLICLALLTQLENRHPLWNSVMLGVVSGFAIINNFEFGVTAFLSVNVTLLLLVIFQHLRLRIWLISIATTVIILASFMLFLLIIRTPMQIQRYVAFSVGFGKDGFGNVPMPFFGTYFLLFSILGIGVITGIFVLCNVGDTNSLRTVEDSSRKKSAALTLYAGMWGIFTFPYYIGRSVTSGQLQIFLIPAALCIFGLATLHVQTSESDKVFIKFKFSVRFSELPLLFLVVLPFAATLQIPNPSFEWSRASGKGSEFSSSSVSNLEVVQSVNLYLSGHPYAKIGFLGNWGNLVSLATGISTVIDQNTLDDSMMTPNLRESLCKSIKTAYPKKLLVERGVLPLPLTTICENVSFESEWSSSLDVYGIRAPSPVDEIELGRD